jgi:hypothetical protein
MDTMWRGGSTRPQLRQSGPCASSIPFVPNGHQAASEKRFRGNACQAPPCSVGRIQQPSTVQRSTADRSLTAERALKSVVMLTNPARLPKRGRKRIFVFQIDARPQAAAAICRQVDGAGRPNGGQKQAQRIVEDVVESAVGLSR